VKEMHMVDDGRRFLERVRLFSADDLAEMMGQAGLHVVQRFGSYAGDELGRDAPRAIIGAQRQ